MELPVNTKVVLPEWWDYSRLLVKVQKEYQDSENYTTNKREKKREQLKLYNNQEKEPERISDNSIYSNLQAWMATTTSDQKSVTWLGREWMDEDIAENLNHLAKFDYEEMKMPELEIKRRWHEWMFGLSILIKKGWDKNRNCPIFETRDPLSWFPDKRGWLRAGNFRYMSFDSTVPLYEIKKNKAYFNTDILAETTRSDVEIRNEVAYAQPRLLQPSEIENNYDGLEDVAVLDHYTRIDGVPYLITLANNRTMIIRVEKIKAVSKAEKEDESLIDFPVILRYFSPIPNDPFGVSLSDLSEDGQTARTILKNLKLLKEKDMALGDTLLVSKKIKNRTDLLKAPSLKQRRFVPVDSDDVSNLTATLPKAQWSSDYYNFEQQLRNDEQLATGISNVQAGATEDTKRTASEIQAVQRNANARFMLWFQIALIADREFWKLWYRCYKEYMTDTSEKFVRITWGLTPKQTTLNRKDITSIEDPDVVLDSEDNIRRYNNEIRDSWLATYNFYIQDTEIPKISKTLFKRKFYQIVQRLTKEEALKYVPQSWEEMKAWEDIKLINRGESINPEPNEDHYTYLMVYQSAEDTKAKWASIEMRKLALIMFGQTQPQGQENTSASQTQWQVVNNMLQQSQQPQTPTF